MGVLQRIRKVLLGEPRTVTHDEFIAQLQRFVGHNEGGWEWDDFESLKITDSELDDMRVQVCKRDVPPNVPHETYEYMRECIAKLRQP